MSITAGRIIQSTRTLIDSNSFATDTHNLISFKQEALVTFNGNQYTSFYDSSGNVMVGKRNILTNIWTVVDSTFNWNDGTDSHDDIVLGIDSDGYIHISWGMHNDVLKYIKSDNPEDISAFSTASMTGSNENSVTYPRFFSANGILFFTYRNGNAFTGNQYLNKYNTTTDTWTALHHAFINGGDYAVYSDNFSVDSNGYIHHTIMWRTSNTPITLEDYTHIYSTDNGTTWKKTDGTAQTIPMTQANCTPFLDGPIDGLCNQQWHDVDGNGRPHVAYWKEASNGHFNYFHNWYNGTSWIETQLTFRDDTPTLIESGVEKPIARAGILCNRNSNEAFVFTRQEKYGYIIVYKSSPPFTQWEEYQLGLYTNGITEFGIFDRERYHSTGILDFIGIPTDTSNPQPIYHFSTNLTDLIIIDTTMKSIQAIVNKLAGTSGLSVQEALCNYFGYTGLPYSEQEIFNIKRGANPTNGNSVQESLWDNLKDTLSLTGPASQYSEQYMWNRAFDAGLTLDQITGNSDPIVDYIKALTSLIAYYPLNETSGNAINNAPSTIGTLDGTIVGGVTQNVDALVGKGYEFNGTSGYIQIASDIMRNRSAYTIGAIINITDTAAIRVVAWESNGTNEGQVRGNLYLDAAEKLIVGGRAGDGEASKSKTTDAALSTGFHFVIGTVDVANDTANFYIDGSLVASTGTMSFTATSTSDTAALTKMRIGAYSNAGLPGLFFNSIMQHVFFMSRLITTQEITDIQNLINA